MKVDPSSSVEQNSGVLKTNPKYSDAIQASKIYILPNAFTAGNLLFGFLAILWCIRAKYTGEADSQSTATEFYNQAVWFILLSFTCDGLDGMVARLGRKESLFGKEFDSIVDMVSFGVAPSLMVIFMILSPLEKYPFFRETSLFIGFIYLLCAGVRLARFNVITSPLLPTLDKLRDNSNFFGLPVPAAAAFIASLVLVLNVYDLQKMSVILPILMLLIAILMVSNIPYPSFKNIDWNTQATPKMFFILACSGTAIFFYRFGAISLLFLGYIFFGIFRYVINTVKSKRINC